MNSQQIKTELETPNSKRKNKLDNINLVLDFGSGRMEDFSEESIENEQTNNNFNNSELIQEELMHTELTHNQVQQLNT